MSRGTHRGHGAGLCPQLFLESAGVRASPGGWWPAASCPADGCWEVSPLPAGMGGAGLCRHRQHAPGPSSAQGPAQAWRRGARAASAPHGGAQLPGVSSPGRWEPHGHQPAGRTASRTGGGPGAQAGAAAVKPRGGPRSEAPGPRGVGPRRQTGSLLWAPGQPGACGSTCVCHRPTARPSPQEGLSLI